ncbi:(S)-ureidoglycine aminohydrolase [Acuticoccus sediminis]|uniref:(S)-ureidoglycine aminohydrolase n=1 Tax=Acuticoccus sediminis TaxID=2184697 RepID=A0A8B2NP01_9HYPH|nr:bifunctional allantoicase/(S)-ureidoglycine aminohydrolase [Acuticoccus sediminis]RAH97392.1 (S)-ureidoglycine aminohydrolase [Acuticoccus sediminis]
MTDFTYRAPDGGLPGQTELHTGRAVFTEAYAVIPRGVMRDIVTSRLPGWSATRLWVLARPLSGFAETFSQYIMEVAPGGGSEKPEPDPEAQAAIFVLSGSLRLTIGAERHTLAPGGFAYVPPGADWKVHNDGQEPVRFQWIRKRWQPAEGLGLPEPIVTSDAEQPLKPTSTPDDRWFATCFIDTDDLRYDMHVNIVTFEPGGVIPFEETHVMEHGLYVLEGKAVYRLNRDWVEVEAGDFMWLRAFCPQACYAGGPTRFRYLLYKDVNRHAPLGPVR